MSEGDLDVLQADSKRQVRLMVSALWQDISDWAGTPDRVGEDGRCESGRGSSSCQRNWVLNGFDCFCMFFVRIQTNLSYVANSYVTRTG